ncbi:MAG: phosphatidylinositol mannoside acyltransferase [Actinomycetota bacterium]
MALDSGRAFALAWRIVPLLPEPLVRRLFDLGALVAWQQGGEGVRQLEKNLVRVRPDATDAELRRLSRDGMRSYMRYYAELFMQKGMPSDELAVRVRARVPDQMQADLEDGSVIVALGHIGNWDMAGAWSSQNIVTVLTVAERLKPERLFQDFLELRERAGSEIIPLNKGGTVFRELLRRAKASTRIVALLADRDLTQSGIEVSLLGQPARLAVGPAALALATRRPLYFAAVRSDRIQQVHGPRKWGIDLEFIGPVEPPPPGPDAIRVYTQRWADLLTAHIREYPTSWHMLQKVFTADLDPQRLARTDNEP